MTRWERMTEWPLAGLAIVFLAAYAWPILEPGLPPGVRWACWATTWVVWGVFVLDYVVRLVEAPERRRWFISHLFDLAVIALPLLRPLQLLRLVTLFRVLNRRAKSTLRGRVGLYVAAGAGLLAFVAALAELDAERGQPGARIHTFGDAAWWAATTMSTVGYGDRYPVTTEGRFIGAGLMISGVALLGSVTAMLASWLVQAVVDEDDEQDDAERAALRAEVSLLSAMVEELLARDRSREERGSGYSTSSE